MKPKTEIKPGMIVDYDNGWYRVRSVFKNGTANLCTVFGKDIQHKKIQVSQLVEDETNWYKSWTQSESYMCM